MAELYEKVTMPKETIEIQKEVFDEKKSKIAKYQKLVVGQEGLLKLIKYELIILLTSPIPGALGLFLRNKFFPKILGSLGKNVTFGSNVVLRHPHKIFIGNNVVIDDNCVLDAKGTNNNGIKIGNGVFIGRNTILSCKNGNITLDDNVNIGFNCEIFSASHVSVGENGLFAAYCYLIGGGHSYDRTDIPVLYQDRPSKGIVLGPNTWLGAGVKILDGITLGRDVIIGAGAVVSRNIPDYCIAAGIPAKVRRNRLIKNQSD